MGGEREVYNIERSPRGILAARGVPSIARHL